MLDGALLFGYNARGLGRKQSGGEGSELIKKFLSQKHFFFNLSEKAVRVQHTKHCICIMNIYYAAVLFLQTVVIMP